MRPSRLTWWMVDKVSSIVNLFISFVRSWLRPTEKDPWMEFMTPIPPPDPILTLRWNAFVKKPKRVLTEEEIKWCLSGIGEEEDQKQTHHDQHGNALLFGVHGE